MGWWLLLGLIGCTVVVVAMLAWGSRHAPWDPDEEHESPGRPVECVCGRELVGGSEQHHLVTQTFDDDAVLAGGAVLGGTAMSADFCPTHCPGGCDRGCPVLRRIA